MADDSFSSEDINALRQVHDHLVSIGDARAPQLRAFLQSQNAMGPPPAAPPLPAGITEQFGGYRPTPAAEWTGVSQIPQGIANLATGHPWVGAAQLATPLAINTPLPLAASDLAARGLEAIPGLIPAGRAGLAGGAGLLKTLGEFNIWKPFSSFEPGFNAARAVWKATGPPAPLPLTPARTGVVAPPPVTYQKQPITPAGRVVPPPPVTYQTQPTPQAKPIVPPPPVTYQKQPITPAGPVVPPPPVTYRAAPEAKPVVPPPPVTYREMPEATGAPKRSPIGPLQFENRFWTAPEGQGKGVPGMAGEPTDVGAEMNGFHAAVERLPGDNPYAPGGPSSSAAGQKAKGYTGGLIKALNIDPTSPLAARQFRALTNASYAAKRLLTTDEARAVIQNIK